MKKVSKNSTPAQGLRKCEFDISPQNIRTKHPVRKESEVPSLRAYVTTGDRFRRAKRQRKNGVVIAMHKAKNGLREKKKGKEEWRGKITNIKKKMT